MSDITEKKLDNYVNKGGTKKGIPNDQQRLFSGLEDEVMQFLEENTAFLDLDLENLDYHCRRSTPEIWVVARHLARFTRLEEEWKRKYKQAEARALLRERGQGSTQKWFLEAISILDPEVDEAFTQYLKAMENRKALEGLLKALDRKNDKIPGLQGRANFLFQMESGRR